MYRIGKHEQAIDCLHDAYQFACEEGNVKEMMESSFLLGNCYANTHDERLMRKYYKRSEMLARTSHFDDDLSTMYYNMGSSYLVWNQLQEAEYYLLESLKNTIHDDGSSRFLSYQKLAMLYCDLHNEEHMKQYLKLANEMDEQDQDPLYHKMNQFVQFYCDEQKKYSAQYLSILEELTFGTSKDKERKNHISYGFRIFHAKYLLDVYKKLRRYKDALYIKECLENEQFS